MHSAIRATHQEVVDRALSLISSIRYASRDDMARLLATILIHQVWVQQIRNAVFFCYRFNI